MRNKQSFTERVKHNQEQHEGMHVFRVPKDRVPALREPIDLICMNKKGKITLICARGNGHNRPNNATKLKLQMLGKKCNARVLYASVNGENSIIFKIIY